MDFGSTSGKQGKSGAGDASPDRRHVEPRRSRRRTANDENEDGWRVAETDPFLDARIWGAPVIGATTAISAPFGWIGLTREFARRCGKQFAGASVRIGAVCIVPSGISIEVEEADPASLRALHLVAHEVGQAATRFDPDTGLLRPQSLRNVILEIAQTTPAAAKVFPLDLPRLADEAARDRLIDDLRTIGSNRRIPPERQGPRLEYWTLSFPRGTTQVQLVGSVRTGSRRRSICEQVLAIDNLKRYARTTTRLYSLRDDSVSDQHGFIRP
jgi:hypothetical protein